MREVDSYHITTRALADEDQQRDFDKLANDDEIAFSDEDHHAMEIINRMIKRVDEYKFQIAVPLH